MFHSTTGYLPGKLCRMLFRPFSLIYESVVMARIFLYKKGILPQYSLHTPVISVGNLSVGGTGKTPVCTFLASYFKNSGWTPAIISRGYKSNKKNRKNKSPLIVSDGHKVDTNAQEAGDEPFLMASKLKGIPVICHHDRYTAGVWAEQNLGSDLFILDDAFQHLRLRRDFDLLLTDANQILGNPLLLPAGPLREPLKNTRRADAILVTRCQPDQKNINRVILKIKEFSKNIPIYTSHFEPDAFIDIHGQSHLLNGKYAPDKIVAFCGIAVPGQFFSSLEAVGLRILKKLIFSDHQEYTAKEISKIVYASKQVAARALITTEKDLVKLKGYSFDIPIYALSIKLIIHQDGLLDYITQKIQKTKLSKEDFL